MFFAILKKEIRSIVVGDNKSASSVILFLLMLMFCEFVLSHGKQNEDSYSLISWVCMVFATQASAQDLFEKDYRDGTMEQILCRAKIPELIVFYKTILHWAFTGLPISIISLTVRSILMPELSVKGCILFFFTAIFGTLSLSFISAAGSALTTAKNNSNNLIAQIIVIPLFFPTIIYIHYLEKNFEIYGNLAGSNILIGLAIFALIPISNMVSFLSLRHDSCNI